MRKFTKLMLTLALVFAGVGGANATETKIHECDYSNKNSYPWYRMEPPEGSSFDVSNGLLVITNNNVQTNYWDLQPFVDDGISTIYGYNYKVRFTLKCTAPGSLTCNMGTWSAAKSASFDVISTDGFVTKEVSLNDFPVSATNVHVLMQAGKYIGTIYIQKVEVIQIEPEAPVKTALANDAIFSFANATNYDAETSTFSANGGWDFATPVNLSDYLYLYITTAQSIPSIAITITDNNNKSVGGDQYNWEKSGTKGGGMWLDNWNHNNVLCINLQYLVEGLGMDITKIKSLKFSGKVIINNVVLSNYASSEFLGKEQYHTYSTGDYQRSYEAADLGKFGTICLPYKAISAGAFIYKIASGSASGISLERVDGILEAGKPYFYQATDDGYVTGDPAVNKPNVNFYCVDWTGSVAAPVANNGLIGTFSEINAPIGGDYYVLGTSTQGVQGLYQVDADANVTVGANKAYIDISGITPSTSRGSVFLNFAESTGIADVEAIRTVENKNIYTLGGQLVNQPTKGLYIMNGKKVVIK